MYSVSIKIKDPFLLQRQELHGSLDLTGTITSAKYQHTKRGILFTHNCTLDADLVCSGLFVSTYIFIGIP